MKADILLLSSGLVLLVVETVVRIRAVGIAGSALAFGGIVALIMPEHFWLAFLLGCALSIIASQWASRLVCGLTDDFTSLVTAASNLIGKEAVVVETIDPKSKQGKIRIGDELWMAESSGSISRGSEVTLDRIDGCRAVVRVNRY